MEDDIPYLPADLVLEKIVPYLPTKSSIRVSSLSKHCWDQGLFFSKPVLNFDEYDDIECVNQHKKFMNFLKGYLKFCLEKGDEEHVLDSLKLHLKTLVPRDEISYGTSDASIVVRWMNHAFERKVKVLDICVGTWVDVSILCLNWVDRFAKAKYLTSLSLEQISLKGVRSSPNDRSNDDEPLLPSLKTLSFKCVRFYKDVIPSWLCESPSLQYMSLTGCNFEYIQLYIQNCPSLRCLEFKYCGRLNYLSVDKVENLQSFTYISLPEPLSKCRELHLDLNVSSNMKNIYIDCLDGLEALYLGGCHALEATIITKSLKYLTFQGHLTAKVSPQACSQANIRLGAEQFWTDQRSLPDDSLPDDSPHFPSVMKFLRNFEWCEEIFLTDPCDFKALVFPESYRKLLPAPLPKSCILVVMMQNPPTEGSGDYLDLMNSLHWIAPSAWIAILPPVGTTDDKEVRAAGEQLLQVREVREVIDTEFSRCWSRGESNDRQQEANQQQYGSSSNQGGGFRSTTLSDKDRVLKTVQESFDGANKLREEPRQMTPPGQEMQSKDKEKLATIRTVGNVQLIGELLKQKTDEGTEVCRIRNNFNVQLFFRIISVFISFMRRLFASHSSLSSSSSKIATTDQEKKKKKNKSARKLARLERELGL